MLPFVKQRKRNSNSSWKKTKNKEHLKKLRHLYVDRPWRIQVITAATQRFLARPLPVTPLSHLFYPPPPFTPYLACLQAYLTHLPSTQTQPHVPGDLLPWVVAYNFICCALSGLVSIVTVRQELDQKDRNPWVTSTDAWRRFSTIPRQPVQVQETV